MKKNSIITIVSLMVAVSQYVMAQKMTVNMVGGQPVEYNVSQVESVTFSDSATSNQANMLSLYPEYVMRPTLTNLKFGTYQYGNNSSSYSPFTLLWFSDIHGNLENLQRIRTFYDQYQDCLDDVLCNGDLSTNTFYVDFSFWEKGGGGKFLTTIGNHDASEQLSPFISVSPRKLYNTIIAPYLKETCIISQENKTYWYKDYPNAKTPNCKGGIRLISLDRYHWKENEWSTFMTYDDGMEIDTGQQEVWLRNLLDDAKEKEIAVIISIHGPSYGKKVSPVNCTFDTLDRNYINAFDVLGADMMEDVQAFINKGGNFVCWLCGHMHQDWFTTLADYPDQVQIVVGTSSYSMKWRDCDMVYNTKAMDRFNIFSVDLEKKYIRLYRIGVDHDRHGRHIGSLVYDYKNKTLIYND